jgi:hypothetical protein
MENECVAEYEAAIGVKDVWYVILALRLVRRLTRPRSDDGWNFVTHYNFLRPHMSLGYKIPIDVKELHWLNTIQEKWCKIIDMARCSEPPCELQMPDIVA